MDQGDSKTVPIATDRGSGSPAKKASKPRTVNWNKSLFAAVQGPRPGIDGVSDLRHLKEQGGFDCDVNAMCPSTKRWNVWYVDVVL